MSQALGLVWRDFALPLTGIATVPWRYIASSDHTVVFLDANGVQVATGAPGTDFTIAPTGDTVANVGVLSLIATPPAGAATLRLYRATPAVQLWSAPKTQKASEKQHDRTILILQEQIESVALKFTELARLSDGRVTYVARAAFVAAPLEGLPEGATVIAAGLAYRKRTGSTAFADKPGFDPVVPLFADHWGVTRGTTGDNTAKLQRMHDWLAANGGGFIDCGPGVIPWASTLYFGEGAPVLFLGHGKGWVMGGKQDTRDTAATIWRYTGAANGAGIKLTTDRNDTGTVKRRGGGGIKGIMLDGGELGGIGLDIYSHSDHELDIHTCWWRQGHVRATCLSNGVAAGAPGVNARLRWRVMTSDVNTSFEPPWQVVINGIGAAANTSLVADLEFELQPESAAVGLHLGDCDTITINKVTCGTRQGATGDGGKVILHANDTLPPSAGTSVANCRFVTLRETACKQGIVAKAALSGSVHSGPNHIVSLGKANAAPDPTIEAGATLTYGTQAGVLRLTSLIGPAVQQSPTDATAGVVLRMDGGLAPTGPFGLGAMTPPTLPDLDDQTQRSGLWRATSVGTVGTRPSGANSFANVTIRHFDNTNIRQRYEPINSTLAWERVCISGVWQAWVQSKPRPVFASRAEATSATTGNTGTADLITVIQNGIALDFLYNAAGTALTTGDGRKWNPAGTKTAPHYGAVANGVTNDQAAAQLGATAAAGGELVFPPGTYLFNTNVVGNGSQIFRLMRGATITGAGTLSGQRNIVDEGGFPVLFNKANLGTAATGAGVQAAFNWTTSENLDATAAGGFYGAYYGMNVGGAGVYGNRTGLESVLTTTAPTADAAGPQFYTALSGRAVGSVNMGGTSLAVTAGRLFGRFGSVTLNSAATFYEAAVGDEIDVACLAGAKPTNKTALQLVQRSIDVEKGNLLDAAMVIANQTGGTAPGWDNGLLFGARIGVWPMAATGTIIGTQTTALGGPAYAAAYGVDWRGVTFANAAFASTGFSVGPAGDTTVNTVKVGANQVLGARRTGWAAPTGTATRTTFATSSVTLPLLAERVKALIDDLTAHGAIGA